MKQGFKGKLSENHNWQRALFAVLFLAFIVGVIPLIYIGRYNFPSADDYASTFKIRGAMAEGYSALGAILINVVRVHFRWQGTFLANFFIYATPAMLDYRIYKFVPILMYGLFFVAQMFFASTLVGMFYKQDRYSCKILALCVLMASIQQVPVPVESFYWWTGSVMYTGCFCLQLLFLGAMFKFMASKENKSPMIKTMLLCLCCLLLGGANYVTALMNCGYLLLAMLYSLWQKSAKLKNIIGIFLFSVLGLLISVTAPGNFNRMADFDSQWSFSLAKLPSMIFECFSLGWQEIPKSLHINIFAFTLLLIPVFYHMASKTKFAFKYPIGVTIFALCVYCAQYAPGVFTNSVAPGRMENIIFYTFIWLWFLTVFYWTGYAEKNIAEKYGDKLTGTAAKMPYLKTAAKAVVVVSLVVGCIVAPSTKIAVLGIADGTIPEYGTHMASLINQCLDPAVEVPTVTEFMNKPIHLCFYPLKPNDGGWGGSELARHYGKKKIAIVPNKIEKPKDEKTVKNEEQQDDKAAKSK